MSSPTGPGDGRPGTGRPGGGGPRGGEPVERGKGSSDTDGPPPWQRGSAGSARSGSTSGGSSGSAPGPRPSGGGIDAPTSQIARTDIPDDMPDLSTTRRSEPRPATPPAEEPRPRRPVAQSVGSRGPRRASLQIKHVDPWSTLKLSLVLSIALFLVWMIAVGILYLVLDGLDVWDRINETFSDFVTVSDPGTTADPLIGPQQVFSVAGIIGLVNIVLLTALTTVSSFVYNISSDLAGGVELTLTERD